MGFIRSEGRNGPLEKIRIQGIGCQVRLGVPDEERAAPQAIEVDVLLTADLQPAVREDDVRGTVDYQRLVERITEIAEKEPVRLAETLADRICTAIFTDPAIREVEVTVRKRPAVLAGKVRSVEVIASRSRSSAAG